ncbi:hypothetical protein [Microcoleus sp. herbarium14]|uniref:hypothetical protein n=1 Tax=Microcoleus sp. herbarium14 TaxID=3055439 RepID=UPI002FD6CD60
MSIIEFIQKINQSTLPLEIIVMPTIEGAAYSWVYVNIEQDTFYGNTFSSPLCAVYDFLTWMDLMSVEPEGASPTLPF